MPQQTTNQHHRSESENLGFGQRLVAAGQVRGRLCVGIDPHPYLLKQWGLEDNVDGLRRFSEACVEAFADSAALVKPQVAFYERFGSQGFAALEETLASLREAGCLTVADAKRGDIGSTMAGYADAWLGESSPLQADAVTVSPYLGVGALQSVFAVAAKTGRGVFVLAATSNPEAIQLQSFTDGSQTVAQHVVDICAAFNAELGSSDAAGEESVPGDIGVVVGATLENPPELSQLNGPVLLPGVGAQGASAADVARITQANPELGFANVSRAVLAAGPQVADLRAAVQETASEFFDGGLV
ncbi:orotidine-5'-phosphate decarboxylase [Corynebacterium sp.]|uniref:orotidine-5'-phosphate decarboxylase n=1 Tax=Corynebacterium sp. TaxID=1720 RepID=UPI0028ACA52A|nr:orotidine-5'-phosphate decarboxylase [Corynebacterium sp.]